MSLDSLTNRRHAVLSPEETPMSRRYLRVLERWIPVGLEYFSDWSDRPNCGHFLGGCHWYGIETIAGAVTFALAAGSPEYNEHTGPCSREELRRVALKAIRYLCFTHDTGPEDCLRPATGLGRPENCGTKWGERGKGFFRESQCGTTVAGLAITALLLGDLVDDETWAMIAAIHADYAARFGEMEPKKGVYFDTQMEENGWTSAGLASVECTLDKSPHAESWARNARRWMFSTATAPQDSKNHQGFDDTHTIAQLTGKIFTALPDYMAENHGMVHPNYTASSVMFLGKLGVIYGVYGRDIPPHARFNRQHIYDQLKFITDRSGMFHPVQGMDWPYLPPDPATGTHAAAALLLGDPDAACLERWALTTLEQRQTGNDGRMFDKELGELCHDIQDPLIIRESAIGGPAYTYLLHRLFGDGPPPTEEEAFETRMRSVKTYPHAGFVFHRHPAGQTSFAWRNCVMALPLNSDGIYTVAPASNSFLAAVTVKDRPDSQDLQALHIDEKTDGFAAAMVMDRAQGTVRQQVLFTGLPNGVSLSVERLIAREDITIERIEQGFLRIINETFSAMPANCHGARTLYTPDGADEFKGYVSTDPDTDIVKTYDRPAWINVDDRLGIVFQGTGAVVYHNRHYFDPWWAVADDLILSRMAAERMVEGGREITRLTALLAPDRTHLETASIRLTPLVSDGDALGVIGAGYLAVACFDGSEALTAKRSAFNAVPVFSGTTTLDGHTISYRPELSSGGVALHPALCHITTEGDFEVTACDAGRIFIRNIGDKTENIHVQDQKCDIAPGGIEMLQV